MAPVLVAAIGIAVAVALGVAAIAVFGRASDGNPSVSLRLPPLSLAGSAAANAQGAVMVGAARSVDNNLVADPALLEDTPAGVLPKIAEDGRKPMDAYARPFDDASKQPRIAIVIGGLGTGQSGTSLAISSLPPEVTLAFAPYDPDLQNWIDQARGAGHEVLVEVPMEPFDFPESDPGPQMLLASASSEENTKRLMWTLSRVTGYIGASNLEGGRFLAEANALEPVMAMFTRRGLLFFDDGTNARSLSQSVSARTKTTSVTAAIAVDGVQMGDAIDEKLRDLELRAQETGAAAGVGMDYPITLQRISSWAANLRSRGYALAPLSAVAKTLAARAAQTAPETGKP